MRSQWTPNWFHSFTFHAAVLRNAFHAFESTEKKGVILTEDLATIVEMLGHRLDDRTQKLAIREVDPAGTGELEFERFAVYASKYVDVEEDIEAVAKELREAFLLYDRDCEHFMNVKRHRWASAREREESENVG